MAGKLCPFFGRTRLRLGWTNTNQGLGAKRCRESGAGGWKSAQPLSPEPGAAAGFFDRRVRTRNPVIPAVANDLVLWDFDDGVLDELARRFGIERMLPAGAWRVRTVDGTHLYTSAPPGRAGLKVEVTPARVTVFKDGYLLAPGGRHPDGLVYELENVDVDNGSGRPPVVSTELYDLVLELAGQGRAGVSSVIDGGGPIAVGDRHVALRHLAGPAR
jgi:hypothetical protein